MDNIDNKSNTAFKIIDYKSNIVSKIIDDDKDTLLKRVV
jgi:hypothetical protein